MGNYLHRRFRLVPDDDEELAVQPAVDSPTREREWTPQAIMAAAVLCLGTAVSTLFHQRVSNAVPEYYYAVAIVSPLLGLFCYSIIGLLRDDDTSAMTPRMFGDIFKYTSWMGLCFALTNLLVDYGRSGTSSGHPDVPAILSLILLKLVVPVSLGLECLLEQQLPSSNQVMGLVVFLFGIAWAAQGTQDESRPSSVNSWKILALVASSLPLAIGLYIVKLARQRFPISGIRLWQILCITELLFSVVLAFATTTRQTSSWKERSSTIFHGVTCVLFGRGSASCREATLYLWSGLPFSLACNIAIPILIALKGSSTAVPLFRAMALPIAALLAMGGLIVVQTTPFSWGAVMGVALCSIGLMVFYYQSNSNLFSTECWMNVVNRPWSGFRSGGRTS